MEFSTSLGRLRGLDLGDVVRVAGVRYAQPPLGDGRFALPRPPLAWAGTVDAVSPSAIPPQLPSRLAAVMGDYPAEQSEDCLRLDIWIPKGHAGSLPVIVFIHGGAFMTGGGGLPCYDGAELARRARAVVVTISYRLGVLGFLPIEGVAPANLGLHDQIAALRFIRREIAAFGGDPGNVTVMGQSAGGLSIAAMLAMPDGPKLFDRAVVMSAPLGISLKTTQQTRELSRLFVEMAGEADRDALLRLDVASILNAQAALLREWAQAGEPDEISPPFMPVIDDDLIHGQIADELARVPPTWCQMTIGATREELAAFWFDRTDLEDYAASVLPDRFGEAFPGKGGAMLSRFRNARAAPGALALLTDLKTHREFVAPSLALAARQAAAGGNAYAYMFDWQSPDPRMGACHCIELPFLFGNLETWAAAPMLRGAPASELAGLSRTFQGALAALITGGETRSALDWPAFGDRQAVMHFDRLSACWPTAAGQVT